MKILVTYGGMQEPIDGVRKITNTSTGNTGKTIVDFLSRSGENITVFRNKYSILHGSDVQSFEYESFNDLKTLISEKFDESFDSVIHLSAISDYCVKSISVDGVEQGLSSKIESGKEISVNLMPTEKQIDLYKVKNPNLFLVGFKLTNNATQELAFSKVRSLFEHSHADLIVHNDMSNMKNGKHNTVIYNSEMQVLSEQDTNEALATSLLKLLKLREMK